MKQIIAEFNNTIIFIGTARPFEYDGDSWYMIETIGRKSIVCLKNDLQNTIKSLNNNYKIVA